MHYSDNPCEFVARPSPVGLSTGTERVQGWTPLWFISGQGEYPEA
jgi:hypothetical protein